MTTTAIDHSREKHPWLDAVKVAPVDAVNDLLQGYAPVFPYTRADAPDAAHVLFGSLPHDDPSLLALDRGIIDWLDDQRREPLPSDPPHLQDRIRQVSEAFEIIALLNLPTSAAKLRNEYIRWASWTERMVLAPSRDAQAAYLRMLANTQRIATSDKADTDSLGPFWIRICRDAGSKYPARYLQIGLLGLRRLPSAVDNGDTPWIAGLAAWAKEQEPSDKAFLRAWRPIKSLHPMTPSQTAKRVYNVLSQREYADADITPPAWWSNDPDLPNTQTGKGQRNVMEPPPPHYRQTLLDDLRNGARFADLEDRLNAMTNMYKRFTDVTGDTYHLKRSFSNVGNALLKGATEARQERAEFAQYLARQTLRYNPWHEYAWSLWRDALFYARSFEASIALGWEAILRFPNDVTMRTELAEILIACKRTDDALNLMEASIEADVSNVVSFSILSRLHSHTGDAVAARDAVDCGLDIDPHDFGLLNALDALNNNRPLVLVSTARQRVIDSMDEPSHRQPSEIERSGTLRGLRNRLAKDQAALNELKSILDNDPTFAYAQLLAARHGIWESTENQLPLFAAAFEEALASEDLIRLEALTQQQPRLASLILLARAILGDETAATEVTNRLRRPDGSEDARMTRTLRHRFEPVLTLVDNGLSAVEAIGKRSQSLRVAIYDTNEILAVPELMRA